MANRLPVVRKDGQIVQIPVGDGLNFRGPINQNPAIESGIVDGYIEFGDIASNTVFVSGNGVIQGFDSSNKVPIGARRIIIMRDDAGSFYTQDGLKIPGYGDSQYVEWALGDTIEWLKVTAQAWMCVNYERSSGQALRPSLDNTKLALDGSNSMSGSFNQSQSITTPSASNLALQTLNSDSIIVTGTTAITSLGSGFDGYRRLIRFTGVLRLTNNSSIIIPGGANVTTAANDVAEFQNIGGASVWRCIRYTRANGTALVGGSGGPATTDQLPEGSSNLYFTAARAQSATRFTWSQDNAAAVWTIPHNTNGFPSVTVVDTLGNVVSPDISYVDANTVQITHGAAYAGKAYIN